MSKLLKLSDHDSVRTGGEFRNPKVSEDALRVAQRKLYVRVAENRRRRGYSLPLRKCTADGVDRR